MSTPGRLRLLKTAPKPRPASPPAPNPDKNREPSNLWKAIAGDSETLRYRPVLVIPELARVLGVNKALILSQLDYWLERSIYEDQSGRRWCYNTLEEWQTSLPWLNVSSIKRMFGELSAEKIVLVEQFDRSRLRRENWYSLDHQAVTAKYSKRVKEIAEENNNKRERIKTRRRFRGGNQPLLSHVMWRSRGSK